MSHQIKNERPAANAEYDRGSIYLYIDNSNLFLQGQKTYAQREHLAVQSDSTWRVDIGRAKDIWLDKCELRVNRKISIKANLYGSEPPPIDSVWKAIERNEIEVSRFRRSAITGREKQVDSALVVDALVQAFDLYSEGAEAEFVIVSGDIDLWSAVNKITTRFGFTVHLWSWKNAMSPKWRRESEKNELLHVHELDPYLYNIGFCETEFNPQRSVIHPHSIVVLDYLTKSDAVKSVYDSLKVPKFTYELSAKDPQSTGKDLVIIPAGALQMAPSLREKIYQQASALLQAHGIKCLTYFEYSQKKFAEVEMQLQISKVLPEHTVPEEEEEVGVDESESNKSDDEGWTDVNKRLLKTQDNKTKKTQSLMKRCDQRKYCRNKDRCRYSHTKEEKQDFKDNPFRTAFNSQMCNKGPEGKDCWLKPRGQCKYAHGMDELFCPICDKVGVGHHVKDCPNSYRNKKRN